MQNINILTLGNPEGKGVFFPEGLLGSIVTPYGFNMTDPGNETFPTSTGNSGKLDTQVGRCNHSASCSVPMLHCVWHFRAPAMQCQAQWSIGTPGALHSWSSEMHSSIRLIWLAAHICWMYARTEIV